MLGMGRRDARQQEGLVCIHVLVLLTHPVPRTCATMMLTGRRKRILKVCVFAYGTHSGKHLSVNEVLLYHAFSPLNVRTESEATPRFSTSALVALWLDNFLSWVLSCALSGV